MLFILFNPRHVPPRLLFTFSVHFRAAQTLTLDSYLPRKNTLAYSFVGVYCMNFIIFFLCFTLKLICFQFRAPPLAPNPGDATVLNCLTVRDVCAQTTFPEDVTPPVAGVNPPRLLLISEVYLVLIVVLAACLLVITIVLIFACRRRQVTYMIVMLGLR